MSAKINSIRGAIIFVALALGLAGCTPAGPGTLLKGKKYLDRGDLTDAVAQFKRATTLLPTNAAAWNYYGVALQRAGQPDAAATAYKQALELNRDLVETHFNLGSLWLEQNKPADAKTEFTAYTLHRPNETAGWLKLGFAQLRLGEIVPAERSFSTVLALKPGDVEAYNGIGLAFVQSGKPRDAAQYFAAAVQSRPDFGPALLNLATTTHEYLHDEPAALKNYRAWLALAPRPANWDEVNTLANNLEQSLAATAPAPAAVAKPIPPAPAPEPPKPQPKIVIAAAHPTPKPQPAEALPEPEVKPTAARQSATRVTNLAANSAPAQVTQVPPEPKIVTTPAMAAHAPVAVTPAKPADGDVTPVEELPVPEPEKKPGFWHKLFGSDHSASAPQPQPLEQRPTPLPAADEPQTKPAPKPPEPAPVSFSHYSYLAPGKPAAGNRPAASGAFTKARLAEQDEKWVDALQWYQTAAQLDPAWFEAQYNTGVLAHRLRNYPLALPSYENALAIQPDSADARYNFALALKAAGHVPDAADEFKKILAANPDEVRAHLALANLCAQTLHDSAQARQHYLKVLELEPQNPQASDIRFWLSANSP